MNFFGIGVYHRSRTKSSRYFQEMRRLQIELHIHLDDVIDFPMIAISFVKDI